MQFDISIQLHRIHFHIGVNFINIIRTNISYERSFSSYVLALLKNLHKKRARIMLMKLTTGRVFLENFSIKKVVGRSIKVYIMKQIWGYNDKIDTTRTNKCLLEIIPHLHFFTLFSNIFWHNFSLSYEKLDKLNLGLTFYL